MADTAVTGVADLLVARAADDALGLVTDDRTWTWREVVEQSATRAAWLRATLDPDRPPHVGILLDNTADFVLTLFGSALAGACAVGVNATRRGAELERDILHTDCRLVITDEAHQALRVPDSPVPSVLVDDPPWQGYDAAPPGRLPDPASLLLLIFTSGSTSAPKAVRRSSARVAAGAPIGFTPADRIYCPMPLVHGNALFGCVFPALAGGSALILRERFSASHWLADVRRHGATFTSSVGRALSYVLATPAGPADRDHELRVVLAPETSPADAAAFTERFGVPVVTGYGSSEGGITLLPSRRHGALGRAPAGTSIAVVDPATGVEKAVADLDEHGRLRNAAAAVGELVRRDSMGGFEGYWANPGADDVRTRDGWFWSGDLAYRDADGVFYFAGRAGDWLRVDSENFAAAPVERIVDRCPDLAAVAVYGVPDAHSGDRVMAAVEVHGGGEFDPAGFASWLRAQPDLGTKWAPTFVRVCKALPTVGIDKIDRRSLRTQAWLTDDPVWWRAGRDDPFQRLDDATRDQLRAAFADHGRIALHPTPAAATPDDGDQA